jgi:precorrin-3B synthase
MADPPLKRGFCPGVLWPMEAGDGLIVRPRLGRGRLAPARLAALADAANRHGNGVVELTRRANLQLRGVSERTLPDLQAELLRLELTPASLAAERAPQVAVSALSQLVRHEPAIEHVASAIEQVLVAGPPRALSAKLLLVVSDEHDACAELHADVRVQLAPGGDVARLSVAGTAEGALELGMYSASAVAPSVARLLAALASLSGARRMRDYVAERGVQPLRALLEAHALAPVPFRRAAALDCLGFHNRAQSWLGLTAPLGWLRADDLAAVARLAERFAARELRLTPARELLVVGIDEAAANELIELARRHQLAPRRALARVALSACSGAPACRSALGETRALAAELGELVSTLATRPLSVHVSGCEKSCARSAAADVTVVPGTHSHRLGFGARVADTLRAAPLARPELMARVLEQLAGAS